MRHLDQNRSFSPVPHRVPSPDGVNFRNNMQTKQITVKVTGVEKRPIVQQIKFLKSEVQRLNGIIQSRQSKDSPVQLTKKDQIIETLKQKLERAERWRTELCKDKPQDQINLENQLFQRIALLEEQNKELFDRLDSSRKYSVSYEGELEDIRDYVLDQITITAEKFKNKLGGRLDLVQNRLINIETFVDSKFNSRNQSQSPHKLNLSFSPSPVQKRNNVFETPPPEQYNNIKKRIVLLQSQLKQQIENYQNLESDNLAIRATLREKEQLLIKMRSEITNSPSKPSYNQLVQHNEYLADNINSLRRNYNDLISKNTKLQDDLSYSLSEAGKSNFLLKSAEQQKDELIDIQNVLQGEVDNLKQQIKQIQRIRLVSPPLLPTIFEPDEIVTQRQQEHQQYILLLERQVAELQKQIRNSKIISNEEQELDSVRFQLEQMNLEHERVLRHSEQVQIQLQTFKQEKKRNSDLYLNELGTHYNILLSEYNQMRDKNKGVEDIILGLQHDHIRMNEQINAKDREIQILRKLFENNSKEIKNEKDENFLKEILEDIQQTKSLLLSTSFEPLKQFVIQVVKKNEKMSIQLVQHLQMSEKNKQQMIIRCSQLNSKQEEINILNIKLSEMTQIIHDYTSFRTNPEEKHYESLAYSEISGYMNQQLKELQWTNSEYKTRIGMILELTQNIESEVRKAAMSN